MNITSTAFINLKFQHLLKVFQIKSCIC